MSQDRRAFLRNSTHIGLGLASGLTILSNAQSARAAVANEKVVLGLIGCGARGFQLSQGFNERTDCVIGAIADVDEAKLEERASAIAGAQQGVVPKVFGDFRKLLDDKSIDAVVIATPDHWHALATVWACQAGKDVYVEKPPTHDCWEGQKMLEAARKYQRVVQCGFQNRSAPYNIAAKEYIESGKLGKVHFCRIYNQKPPWGNCPVVADSDPPPKLNWDMWNGPAPEHRYNASMHECWHHQWNYSGGDIANDASHQIDLARWLLGVTYPKSVYSTGGRHSVRSAAETPDTQIAVYDYDGLTVTFELTLFAPYIIKEDQALRDSDIFPHWMQNATRIEIFGTKGMMVVGRHGGGWQVFTRPRKRLPVVKDEMHGRFPDRDHKENFLTCIRTRETPNADIQQAHLSALMIHYGNISYRLGAEKLVIDPNTEHIVDNVNAMQLFKRTYRSPWVLPENV